MANEQLNQHEVSIEVLLSRLTQMSSQIERLVSLLTEKSAENNNIEPPMTLEEAAAFTNYEPASFYVWAPKGLIPAHWKHRRWHFFKSELVQWIRTAETAESKKVAAKFEADFLAVNRRSKQ